MGEGTGGAGGGVREAAQLMRRMEGAERELVKAFLGGDEGEVRESAQRQRHTTMEKPPLTNPNPYPTRRRTSTGTSPTFSLR